MEEPTKNKPVSSKEPSRLEGQVESPANAPEQSTLPKHDFWIDSRYYAIKLLGEGAFGSVYLVFDDLSEEYFALKMARHKKFDEIIQNEIEIMKKLALSGNQNSTFVTHLHDYNTSRGIMMSSKGDLLGADVPYFITEHASEGDLATSIVRNDEMFKNGIPEAAVFNIFKQLLLGVEGIHQQGFVHLDLKPDNILIMSQTNVCISDFAQWKPIHGEDGRGNFAAYKAGSKAYWSPEMFSRTPYNGVQSDLYALGIILFIVAFGCYPYQQSSLDDLYFYKMVHNPLEFWRWHPETSKRIAENSISAELVKLINFMLWPYPQYRLSIEQIKRQKWYANYESEEEVSKPNGEDLVEASELKNSEDAFLDLDETDSLETKKS